MSDPCPVCGRVLKNAHGLASHIGRKHAQPDGKCQVPDCEKPARSEVRAGAKIFRRWCSMHAKRRETAAALAKGNTCSLPSCDRPVAQSRSMCPAHISRLQAHGEVMESVPVRAGVRITSNTCQVEGCDRPRILYRGGPNTTSGRHCPGHRDRLRRYGTTFPDIPIPAPFSALKASAALRGK